MSKRVINGEADVWISTGSHIGPEEIGTREFGSLINSISFLRGDFSKYGYTRIGKATINVEFAGTDELVTNKVESIRAEKAALLAETQLKVNQFDKQINQLLAIELSPEAS